MKRLVQSFLIVMATVGCATGSGRMAGTSASHRTGDLRGHSPTDRACDLVTTTDVDNRFFNSSATSKMASGEDLNCPTMATVTPGGTMGMTGRLR
jgi:hypothetical protein